MEYPRHGLSGSGDKGLEGSRGSPDVCVAKCRNVMRDPPCRGIVTPLGKYLETGSSNFTSPCWTLSLNRSEVNTFVTDPIWNTSLRPAVGGRSSPGTHRKRLFCQPVQ